MMYKAQKKHSDQIYTFASSLSLDTHTHTHTLFRNSLKESSEALVALCESEGEQHDVRGGDKRDWIPHCLTQPTGEKIISISRIFLNTWWHRRSPSPAISYCYILMQLLQLLYYPDYLTTNLCKDLALIGSSASYTLSASCMQSLGSMSRLFTVSRMMVPGADVSLTWQLRPPHDEKTFRGTLTSGRPAYSLSTHSEPDTEAEQCELKAQGCEAHAAQTNQTPNALPAAMDV